MGRSPSNNGLRGNKAMNYDLDDPVGQYLVRLSVLDQIEADRSGLDRAVYAELLREREKQTAPREAASRLAIQRAASVGALNLIAGASNLPANRLADRVVVAERQKAALEVRAAISPIQYIYCCRTGQVIGQRDPLAQALVEAVPGQMSDRVYHPAWIDTSPARLRLLQLHDPVGYAVQAWQVLTAALPVPRPITAWDQETDRPYAAIVYQLRPGRSAGSAIACGLLATLISSTVSICR